jgi:hypothetical protein
MRNAMIFLGILVYFTGTLAATHVFWYKATTNGYDLQANAGGKGPNLPAGVVVHQGKIATGSVAQHTNSNGDAFVVGSGTDDTQGRCGWFWSQDLCGLTGTITSAKIRAEYRDGWSGNAFCNAGPIAINRGVVDFADNLVFWGDASSVPGDATWRDDANMVGSFMFYSAVGEAKKADDVLNITAPAGRVDDISGSVLDGQFMEIDCTPQVQWILANTAVAGNPSGLSGQYAIVFLVAPNQGDTGKINTYSFENCVPGLGSDAPWTTDGNTAHLVLEGDVVSVEKASVKVPLSGISLAQNSPNPFMPKTVIAYNTDSKNGDIKIYDANGKLVHTAAVSGKGSIEWNASSMVSGIYMYRLTVGSKVISKKMILMK